MIAPAQVGCLGKERVLMVLEGALEGSTEASEGMSYEVECTNHATCMLC